MALKGQRGQSTVEFALVLPLVVILMMALLQAGLLLRDQLVLTAAAREGAREAAVTADRGRIERAVNRAAPGLEVEVRVDRSSKRGDPVTVEVSGPPTRLPLVGAMVSGILLDSAATMRVEKAG